MASRRGPPLTSSSAALLKKPTTLHNFPLLPKEIREKIWELAAKDDRSIGIVYDNKRDIFYSKDTPTVPALLRTCSEARQRLLQINAYEMLEVVVPNSKAS